MSTVGSPISRIPHHGRRILVIWLVSSVVAVPLIIWLLGPQLPPGRMSSEARGHAPTQTLWIVATSAVVLALAVWGSYTLIASAHGAGGGQGPNPVAKPGDAGQALQVQVIGQQWNWTYRYRAYGNVETLQLYLPVATAIELHVTSLDVTHSFWAYELGVKADAVAGVDNIAYVHPRKVGTVQIRCAELCGIWHGHMAQTGHVVSRDRFRTWIAQQQAAEHANLKYLPPYSRSYYPEPLRRAG